MILEEVVKDLIVRICCKFLVFIGVVFVMNKYGVYVGVCYGWIF